MYNSIRRGLKRKEPGLDAGIGERLIFRLIFDFLQYKYTGEYQSGVNQFRATARKRESMRLKNQMNSAPGVLEKELMSKIQVEESVCQGIVKFLNACKNETQSLEAAKNLQLGQLRVDMLKFELNKFRRGRGSPARKIGIIKHHYTVQSIQNIFQGILVMQL